MKIFKKLSLMICILLLPLAAFGEDNVEELEPIEIMATRTSITEENQSAAITIITQEEIQQKQHMQVKDILREQLGINVVTVGPLGATSTVFMRGANSQSTLVMIDGVQVNANTTGGFDFSNLQMDNIERIEILRGPQSTLWGGDAVGGVINIITKKGKGKPTHSLAFEGGSFATFKETLTSSGAIQKFDYALSASRTDSEGFSSASEERGATENDGFGNTTLSSRLGLNFLDDGRIDFIGRYLKTRNDFDALGPTDSIPETGLTEAFTVALPIQKSITSWWDSRINTNFNYEDLEFPTFPSRILNRTYTVDFQNNLELGQLFSAVLGYEYQVTNGSNRGNFSFENRSHGIYLQGNFNYKDTAFLTAGFRENVNSEFNDKLTYKFEGALISKDTGTKFRANYATGFRVPTINDLFFPGFNNPNISPEESKNWELGLEQKLLQDQLTLGVSYFNADYDDLIESSGFPLFIPMNVASAESQGIESFINYRITNDLDLTANYTWNEAKDNATNQPLERRPRGVATGTLHYNWDKKLDSLVTVQYRSGMISGSGRVGGRTLVRAALSYRINKNWKLTARGENLLDKNYEESVGFGTAGISGYGGFVYSFN
ncbi:MAG: TonB-dependent receptor [Nitrospina sp.]|nr:MAG: TonB-dependent receptor [Nitrospina sp.]